MFTKLEIINEMLSSTGARPLLAESNRHPLYMKAERKLVRVTQTVLALSLWFNTEVRVLEPQTTGEIQVPINCIKADATDRSWNITLRGNRIYCLNAASYKLNKPIRLRMAFNLEWEEIPTVAQDYIRARAVYEFYLDEGGADPKLANYRTERNEAWSAMYREHIRSSKFNMFDNPSNTVSKVRKGYSTRPSIQYVGRNDPIIRNVTNSVVIPELEPYDYTETYEEAKK